MSKFAFRVEGLDCAEEIAILKRQVGPIVGGEDALSFQVLHGKMMIETAEETPAETICAAVAKTGMKAVLWESYEKAQKTGLFGPSRARVNAH